MAPESGRVELRMRCPVCGVRNHSVTFQHDGPTLYHDCGHNDSQDVEKAIPASTRGWTLPTETYRAAIGGDDGETARRGHPPQ